MIRPITVALLAIVALAALAPAPARAQRPTPPQGSPLATDGAYVAWAGPVSEAPDAPYAIYAMELATGQTSVVVERQRLDRGDPGLGDIALSAGTLIWIERGAEESALWARRLAGGPSREVARGPIVAPAIAGTQVSWWEQGGLDRPYLLKSYDLASSAQPATLTEHPFTLYGLGPTQRSERWIVWSQAYGTAKVVACWELFARPAGPGETRRLGDLGCGARDRFGLAGDQVSFIDGKAGALVVVDLASGTTTTSQLGCPVGGRSGVTVHCVTVHGLAAAGRYAYFIKADDPELPTAYELWGYDARSGSAFVVDAAAQIGELAGGGETLAYIRGATGGERALRVVGVGETLPTAAEPPPGSADLAYFPESGHSLRGAFRSFWERNGGLAVFGYPLTREFLQEQGPERSGVPTQYLERQRFEHHPANPEPYRVLLGRLGADALAAQGRDWQALPKADPAAPHYVAATGQAIAPEFWDYWRTHGLELGDPGVSEREALALFGHPLTPAAPEQLPDGRTRLVQWFERARFEYHPDNPEPYRVLLGRLGAEQVEAQYR